MRFEYQLLTNSWSYFPIVGSRESSKPFGTTFSWIQGDRKSLCELYCADFFLKRFSLMVSALVLWDLLGLAVNKFGLVLSPSSVIVDFKAWFTSISGVRSSVCPLNLYIHSNYICTNHNIYTNQFLLLVS